MVEGDVAGEEEVALASGVAVLMVGLGERAGAEVATTSGATVALRWLVE